MNLKCNRCYLQDFKPKLFFHPKETIQPITWEKYIKKSKYLKKDRITFNSDYEKIDQKSINDIPFYGSVTHNEYFTDLVYIFIYPINPGYYICGKNVGFHTADIEHIIIRINNLTNIITKVYFSCHSKEHQIYKPQDLYFDENNHLKVFVSLHSHANYNKCKTFYRIMGFANDKTKENGVVWYPKKVIDISTMKKTHLKTIGTNNKNKFCVAGLFNRKFTFDKYYKITKLKRFFLPFI